MSSQIFNIVKNALVDNEIEELPTDKVRGLDFKIVKTSKGGYADYSTSSWARRERALNEAELAALDKYGPFDLKNFLPKKPTEVELKVIKEMFEASVEGEAYDPERWGQYYKPAGVNISSNANSAPKATSPSTSNDTEVDEEVDTVVSSTTAEPVVEAKASNSDAGSRAADIIAMIRKRQQQ